MDTLSRVISHLGSSCSPCVAGADTVPLCQTPLILAEVFIPTNLCMYFSRRLVSWDPGSTLSPLRCISPFWGGNLGARCGSLSPVAGRAVHAGSEW